MLRKWRFALMLLAVSVVSAAAQTPAPPGAAGLLPLLIDLPGWNAEPPAQEVSPDLVVAAGRNYSRGGAKLEVGIVAGPGTAEFIQRASLAPGTNSRTVRTQGHTTDVVVVGGFTVVTTVNDNAPEGIVFVVVSDGAMVPAIFMLSFTAVAADEVMEIAKRFDWAAMRTRLRDVR